MSADLIDGKKVAFELTTEIKHTVESRKIRGARSPGLAVVLVGENSASQIYVKKKIEACEQVGFLSQVHRLPQETAQNTLIQLIQTLNQDVAIDGILVQLPLPEHIDSHHVLDSILPDKDVDGFHPHNIGLLLQKRPLLRPCTPYGIIRLLDAYQVPLRGLNATVVGASNIVGRPMSLELLLAGCTVTTCHSGTRDLSEHVNRAELLIVATGKPDLVQAEWIKPGAIVIDVGIHRQTDGSLRGDLHFQTAAEIARLITPVPGGVGPMTVATLLANTLFAAEQLHT